MTSAVSLSCVLAFLALAGCSGSEPQAAEATPSTLVSVVRPEQGSLPALVEAYGTAAPTPNGVATVSVPQPGQVTAVLVTQGATVSAGQPVAVFAVSPSAHSSYVQASDALRAAEAQRSTTAQLLSQQLATRDQLVQATKAVADARAALSALRAEGAGSGTITLRSPFPGIVNAVSAAPGDRTQPGQALVTIAKSGAVVVTVGVNAAVGSRLHAGAPAQLQRVDGSGGKVGGRVVRLHAILNPRTRLIDVDIAYPTGAIIPGEAVRVSIETGAISGWLMPHRAIALDPNGRPQIFQVIGGKAHAIPVTIAASTADRDVVSGGIIANRPVIVDGAYQVSEGDRVRAGVQK
jgi:RND family efflux transporter MFP subunit